MVEALAEIGLGFIVLVGVCLLIVLFWLIKKGGVRGDKD